jgi:hypothetical protein
MPDRLSRLAPLTGLLFAVLAVVAIVTGGESPGTNEPPAKIVAYYATHRSEVKTSALLFALAFLILVLFAASLRSYLRRTPAAEGLSALVLAGSVLIAAGTSISSGVEFGLANEIHHLGPEAVQTLNFITEEVAFLPVVGGAFLLALASGLAILRGARLPKWLGWVAIVLGIAALIPPASFPSLLGFAIWSAIVSILIYRRTGPAASAGPVADAPSALGTSTG